MSVERPKIEDHSLLYDSFTIELDSKITGVVEEIDIKDERLLKAWPANLYRSLIEIPESVRWTISLKEVL